MEGLIPFVYRAIVHYKNGGRTPAGNPFFNGSPSLSPSASYMRLAGDSGRFLMASEMQLYSSTTAAAAAAVITSNGTQSPCCIPCHMDMARRPKRRSAAC